MKFTSLRVGKQLDFPPPHRLTAAVAYERALSTSGTIVAPATPATPWEKWWSGLGLRRGSGADVITVLRLGHASDRLRGRPAEARRASCDRNVFAIRLDYRRR